MLAARSVTWSGSGSRDERTFSGRPGAPRLEGKSVDREVREVTDCAGLSALLVNFQDDLWSMWIAALPGGDFSARPDFT